MNDFRPEYIQAAIQSEAHGVAIAAPSSRNDSLNRAAFNLASLGISGNEIIHNLRPAALQCGLKNGEIYPTINSGMRAGRRHPRSAFGNGYERPQSKTSVHAVEASAGMLPRRVDPNSLPSCDAPDKFKVVGDSGPS